MRLALSPKRAWYQHVEVGGYWGGGERGRKWRQRGEGERVLTDVERAETVLQSWHSSLWRSCNSFDGWGWVTAATLGEPAEIMLSPSSVS